MKVCTVNPFLSKNLLDASLVMCIYAPSTGGSGVLVVGSFSEVMMEMDPNYIWLNHLESPIIYKVHDEAKDKAFELEMSWVCDESKQQHQKVPDELLEEKSRGCS